MVNTFIDKIQRQNVNVIVEYSSVKSFDLKSELEQAVSILTAKRKSRQADKIFSSLKKEMRDFLGGPVAGAPHSQCRGPGFDPWSGRWIPHAATKDPACRN